ncbi:TPA: Ig-like domain-containing protein, partial [Morganella morganii]|nr:Ig-like domain-containing protein [Morganella morganii]
KSVLTATPLSIVANNTETSVLTLTLKDGNDNPVSGERVEFTTELAEAVFSAVTDNGDGNYTASLKGTKAGSAEISVMLDGSPFDVTPVTVKLTGDPNTAVLESVILDDEQIRKVANGTDYFEFIAAVRDSNNNPVSNIAVNWLTSAGNKVILSQPETQTDAEGNAKIRVISTKTPAKDIIVSASLGSQSMDADKHVSFEELLSISGFVIDATKQGDTPVNGADVKIFTEDMQSVAFEKKLNATGKFTAELFSGNYVIIITADGYDDYREPLNINSANTNFKFGLSPILGSLSARIILQWSTAPDDLDMYLLVPPESGGNSRIKVSYQNTSPQGADATLDNDDKAAPGIETITINKLHKGTYTLYVQNYSGPDAKLSTAQVQLNLNNNLTLSGEGTHNMKFYAPDAVVPKSDYWIVFDMIVDNDNNVQIIKRNTVSVSEP